MPTIAARHPQTSPFADIRARLRAIFGGAPAFRRFDRGSRRDSHPCSTPGHVSWDLESKGALPALSRPSPVTAPHASAVIPKGMMPEAAPARVASPRGSTALAPHCGSHPECVPRRARFSFVTEIRTSVKPRVTLTVTKSAADRRLRRVKWNQRTGRNPLSLFAFPPWGHLHVGRSGFCGIACRCVVGRATGTYE
jgi:hypothetical protein